MPAEVVDAADVVEVLGFSVDEALAAAEVLVLLWLDDVDVAAAVLEAAEMTLRAVLTLLAIIVLDPMLSLPLPAPTDTTFGHRVLTPWPWKNNPINVCGSARVPTHAVLIKSEMAWRSAMQDFEQGFPSLKSFAEHSVMGVL